MFTLRKVSASFSKSLSVPLGVSSMGALGSNLVLVSRNQSCGIFKTCKEFRFDYCIMDFLVLRREQATWKASLLARCEGDSKLTKAFAIDVVSLQFVHAHWIPPERGVVKKPRNNLLSVPFLARGKFGGRFFKGREPVRHFLT